MKPELRRLPADGGGSAVQPIDAPPAPQVGLPYDVRPRSARGFLPARGPLAIYFAPDFTEVSTIGRAQGFFDNGFNVAVFAFRRGRYNPHFQSPWIEVELGKTTDGKYFQRAVKMVGAIRRLWANRRLLRHGKIFYARNIDQLALAFLARWLARAPAKIVYEVLDIPAVFMRDGAATRFLRWAESRMLAHIEGLVVSSPAFLRCYYQAVQTYRGPAFLIENRLHPSAVAVLRARNHDAPRIDLPRDRYKWTIGYFGLIRGQKTFDLMVAVAERFPDVLIYLRGIVTTVDPHLFATAIAGHENMIYGGAYVNPDDLGELYGAIDFTWAIDLEHEDHNSRWLMPCRFYESAALGVPCLAAEGFEVGNRLTDLGIGWTLAAPYEESFAKLFATLTVEDVAAVKARVAALPAATFTAGADMAALCAALRMEEKRTTA